MIEDDDSFQQQEGLPMLDDDERGTFRAPVIWLIIILAWFLWAVLLCALMGPGVLDAIDESGVIPLIQALDEEPAGSTVPTVRLTYPRYDGSIVEVEVPAPGIAADRLHDTVEALFGPVPREALAQGAFSLIDEGCTLEGLTAREGICYVEVGGSGLGGKVLPSGYDATSQLRDTLLLFDAIEEVVVIEG